MWGAGRAPVCKQGLGTPSPWEGLRASRMRHSGSKAQILSCWPAFHPCLLGPGLLQQTLSKGRSPGGSSGLPILPKEPSAGISRIQPLGTAGPAHSPPLPGPSQARAGHCFSAKSATQPLPAPGLVQLLGSHRTTCTQSSLQAVGSADTCSAATRGSSPGCPPSRLPPRKREVGILMFTSQEAWEEEADQQAEEVPEVAGSPPSCDPIPGLSLR